MWHVSTRSGVATLRTAMHLLLAYILPLRITLRLNIDRGQVMACAIIIPKVGDRGPQLNEIGCPRVYLQTAPRSVHPFCRAQTRYQYTHVTHIGFICNETALRV